MSALVGVIDGGGSKTRGAMVSDSGTVRLTPVLSGSNPQDAADWKDVLSRLLEEMTDAELIVAGIAGYGEVPGLDAEMRDFLSAKARPGQSIQPMNDVELALHAAFPGGGGVLLVCGTGSMAMANGPRGIVRTGGWGHVIGDEGSAYWIGRIALGMASRELDGRQGNSGFAAGLIEALGLDANDPFALLGWVMRQHHERSAIAGLARSVDRLADKGNATAIRILADAAAHLAELITTAAQLAELPENAPWRGTGSTLQSATLTRSLSDLIGPAEGHARTPLVGGLIHAAQKAGWPAPPDWQETLRRALETELSKETS